MVSARFDYGWRPAPGFTRERMAWETPQGERIAHVARLNGLRHRAAGLRVYLAPGCDPDDVADIRFEGRTGRLTIVGEPTP
ncbi:hypothetical protein X728_09055 [Mesorhizobium sp. L103C120A0]|nr:hypothetical protein X728_09055 [Mesorhizobium sp. L103C120A0]